MARDRRTSVEIFFSLQIFGSKCWSVEAVEGLALSRVVKLAVEKGRNKVVFEGDCLKIINAYAAAGEIEDPSWEAADFIKIVKNLSCGFCFFFF